MLSKRNKQVRAQPVERGLAQDLPGDHPVTNHESFSHSVLFAGAHEWRQAVAPLLHGRSHGHPALKPHQHVNGDPSAYLNRGADVRPARKDKNV